MLTLACIGPDGIDYPENQVALGIEEYYLGVKEAPGEWVGESAKRLGLEGRVEREAFHRVLSHVDPSTGEPLTTGKSDPKVLAIDATFCAPKSVSLLFALGSGEVSNEVRNSHDAAVRAAVGFYEQVAQGRRGHAGCEIVAGDGFVAAAYRHRTSRAAEPHLHTHAIIANLVHSSSDGRWTALDGRPLFSWAKTIGHLYNAHLRYELTRRTGVRWQPVKRGLADIRGIARSTIDAFSTRRRQIEAALKRAGLRSAKAAQKAAYRTRTPKDLSLDAQTLMKQWRALAAEHGLDADALDRLCEPTRARELAPEPGTAAAEESYALLASPEGLTANRSTFDVRHVIEGICEQLTDGAPVDQVLELAAGFLASGHVIALDGHGLAVEDRLRRSGDRRLVPSGDGLCRYTTPEMVATERRLLERAVTRRHEQTAIVPTGMIDQAIRLRPTLADEQVAMVRAVCGSGDGVEVVRGLAGAGKTYALGAAADAFTAAGHPVVGCALAAKAAAGLQEATGIPSMSLDRLLKALDDGGVRLTAGQVIVVDEAAMIGTRKLDRLLDHAGQVRAKVVLIGDPSQLPEIEAGGAFEALDRTLGSTALTENRRQTVTWERDALHSLRTGDVDTAIDLYRSNGCIHDGGDVRERLVRDWVTACGDRNKGWVTGRGDRPTAVMLAATGAEVDDLNDRARERLRARGDLGPDQVVLDGRGYTVGDEVLALRNDYRRHVLNGTRLLLLDIDPDAREIHVVDDRGRPITIDFLYAEAGYLAHGYAMTIHKAQGATVERAFVLARPEAFTAELGYTALSRAASGTELYLDERSMLERETHAPPGGVAPDTLERLSASLQRVLREPLAIDHPPAELQPVAALQAERDRLRRQLGPRPEDHRRRLTALEHQIRALRESHRYAAVRLNQAQDELDRFGRVNRRLHPSRLVGLEQRLDRALGDFDRYSQQLEHAVGEHRALSTEQRGVDRWEATHAPELRRLEDLDRRIELTQRLGWSNARTLTRPGAEHDLGLGL